MKRLDIDYNVTTTVHYEKAFEVYQREYLCKSEEDIRQEKAKFEKCLAYVKS